MTENIERQTINTIRMLAVDAVQAANSGHPGAPLGMAPMAYVLWHRFLKHDPAHPDWFNRDRFVLSPGHASALLYALLHLTGYDLSLEEIKNFRQWNSKTPGHPERGQTPGVEITTGPLGQGFAHGVGLALAESWLATRVNRPGHAIINHYTYGIVSDGDLQEGISYEAASLAGHWKLGKLIYLYDDNDVQIEGPTDTNFTEDVAWRFQAQNWQVLGPLDGEDLEQLDRALRQAQECLDQPSLIIVKTTIGYGSPLAGSAACHGAPLGAQNVVRTKENLGWPTAEPFHVPKDVRAHMNTALERGARARREWQAKWDAFATAHAEAAAKLTGQLAGELPADWDEGLDSLFDDSGKPTATRAASGLALNKLAQKIEWLIGGSADLGPSNQTVVKDRPFLSAAEPDGTNIHFGVREHAMGAIAGGLALHGGLLPYTGTFLTFADYMRTPMRLAALMGLRVVYVFSHDSIGVGEDGPTHQPIEHLASLRAIPDLIVFRPGDARETVEAWKAAVRRRHGPTALVLTRQSIPLLDRTVCAPAAGAQRGGYVLWESSPLVPDLILIAGGSELSLAYEAAQRLASDNVAVRVVSLPCWELFEAQEASYRETVLPRGVRRRIGVEAGCSQGWSRYLGLDGVFIGIDRFGASAPAETLFEKFGVTGDRIVAAAKKLLE